jgi:hypothetical protein
MGPDAMAATSTLSEHSLPATLSLSIPRLETNGSNWATFSMHFQEVMEASQKWGHFDGSTPHPVPKDPAAPTADEKKELTAWDHAEAVSCYMLSQRLPDSTAVQLKSLSSACTRWDKVKTEFSIKGQYAEADLLNKMHCPRGGNRVVHGRDLLATYWTTYFSLIYDLLPNVK